MKLKKVLLGIVTFAAFSVIAAVCASAEVISGVWKYNINSNSTTITITGYTGFTDDKFEIPATIDGYTVTEIADLAFKDNTNIEGKLVIPSTVTKIGRYAFANTGITSVTVPESVVTFDHYYEEFNQFSGCKNLKTVTFNASAWIPNSCFKDCTALTTVTIGDGVDSIGEKAFQYCEALTSVTGGANVEAIGFAAFENTYALKSFGLKSSCLKSYGDFAFAGSGIQTFNIPSTVTKMGRRAFSNTKLTKITVPENVAEFGYYYDECHAFADNSELKTVVYNGKVMPNGAFKGCHKLKSVVIGDSTESLGSNAISYCSVLESVRIGDKVERIGYAAFEGCVKLTDISFGTRLYVIDEFAFNNTGLKSIVIPNTVTYLGRNVCCNNQFLTEAIIPSSVESYGYYYSNNEQFANCPQLKSVTFGSCAMPGNGDMFENSPNVTVYCIKGSDAETYAKNNGIKYSSTVKSIPSTSAALNAKAYNLNAGEKLYLYPKVSPDNTTDAVKWISGDNSIATVNAGVVYGVKDGTVAIQCITTGGKKFTAMITVGGGAATSVEKNKNPKAVSLAYLKSAIPNQAYTGKALKPAFTLMYNDITRLQPGTDYTVSYSANTNVGTAQVTVTGKGHYTGTLKLSFKIVPKQVTGLKVTARSATSVNLKWTKASSGAGYKVQQYKSGKWTTIKTITGNSTVKCGVSGLKAGTKYKFRVCAYKGSLNGAYSTTLNVTTNPSQVTNLKASAVTTTSVTLKWDKNTSGTGYKVQQYKSGKWTTIKTITKNSTVKYTVKGLKAGTAYKFRVRAYKGSLYGALSKTLSATTNLSQVKSLAVSAKTKNSVTLKWAKNTSGAGYKVEQLVNGKWKVIKTITKNTTTTCKVTGLKAGTTYRFRVRAYKDKKYGAYSSTLKVTTKK